MSELKPCPFCGGEATTVDYDWYPYEAGVSCKNCSGSRTEKFQETSRAIAAWNARPLEAALEARIAELEAENLELQKSLVDVTHKYILATEAADGEEED